MKKTAFILLALLMTVMPWTGSVALADSPYPARMIYQFGTDYTDVVNGIATDPLGNIYLVGFTGGTFPGQSERAGKLDAILCKFNSAGVMQWARQFGSPNHSYVVGVAADAAGSVCVVGYTDGAFPGQTYLGGADGYDAFLCKFNNAGVLLWTRQFGTTLDDYAKGVAIDSSGNIYVGAKTYGLLGQSSAGDSDVVIRKYNSDGVVQWTSQFGSWGGDHDWNLVLDATGNIYVAGKTNGQFAGQPHPGGWDVFVSKCNSAGVMQWTREFGTLYPDDASGVAVDAAGNVYVSGWTGGALYPGASSGCYDAFLRKYNNDGIEQWTRQFGTSANDFACSEQSLAVDAPGNAYVVGYTGGAFPGYANSGGDDAFIRKYSGAGIEQWTLQFGTAADDSGRGVTIDTSGSVYMSGITAGAFPGYINESSYYDAFLAKFTILYITEYRWSTVHTPNYKWDPYPSTFKSWQQVRLVNNGTSDVFNVKATITWVPANVTIVDGQVSFGNISADGSVLSSDDIVLVTDMTQPQSPGQKIVWKVEYDYAGAHYEIENVSQ